MPSYTAEVLADGPLGFWKLDDSSGTQATDYSGNGRHGTYSGISAYQVAGPNSANLPYAVRLNGTSSYISLPSAAVQPSASGELTLEIWGRITAIANFARLFDLGNGQSTNNVFMCPSFGSFLYGEQTWAQSAVSPAAWPDTTGWHHAVATMGTTTTSVYLDGSFLGSALRTPPDQVARALNYIGRSNWASDPYLTGDVAAAATYNYVLSGTRVAAHYAASTFVVTPDTTGDPLIQRQPGGGGAFQRGPVKTFQRAGRRRRKTVDTAVSAELAKLSTLAADTSTSADTVTILQVTAFDSAVGSETANTGTNNITDSDTATGGEAAGLRTSATDTATSGEAVALAESVTDSATSAEAVKATTAGADTATTAEATSLVGTSTATDSATSAEAASGRLGTSDSVTAGESVSAGTAGSDPGAGADASGLRTSASDSAASAESTSLSGSSVATDTATAAELTNAATSTSDAATTAEAATATGQTTAQDPATTAETATAVGQASAADTSTSAEAVAMALLVTDSAVGGDGALFTGTAYLTPDSDVSTGAWTTDTGATTNLYQAIDEPTPNDSDYIQSELSPASSPTIIHLSGVTDPHVSTGHTIAYRYQASGTGTIDLVVDLMQGATVIASWTHTTIPGSWVTANQTLDATQADSISDYTDLRLRFTANQTG